LLPWPLRSPLWLLPWLLPQSWAAAMHCARTPLHKESGKTVFVYVSLDVVKRDPQLRLLYVCSSAPLTPLLLLLLLLPHH
jgi:hypothetical protein